MFRQPAFGNGHAHGVGETLPERSGGGLDTGSQSVFGMARSFTLPLAKTFQFIKRKVVAGQMQHAVKQHRGMSPGQHEPVAIGPGRVAGIVTQELFPEPISNRGQSHRGARVTGVGLLYPVHRQRADRIDTKLVDRLGLRVVQGHGWGRF